MGRAGERLGRPGVRPGGSSVETHHAHGTYRVWGGVVFRLQPHGEGEGEGLLTDERGRDRGEGEEEKEDGCVGQDD